MALDDKNIRKKKNLQSDRGSEKNRIKNITSKVHPEYAASSNRKRSSRELSEEEREKRAQIAEARRRRQHQERRRKIIQRRKRQRALRIIASCGASFTVTAKETVFSSPAGRDSITNVA